MCEILLCWSREQIEINVPESWNSSFDQANPLSIKKARDKADAEVKRRAQLGVVLKIYGICMFKDKRSMPSMDGRGTRHLLPRGLIVTSCRLVRTK